MDKKEYMDLLKKINDDCEAAKKKLAHDYAVYNNEVTKGQFVEDHIGTIKVESISFCMGTIGNDFPQCIYSGPKVTKSGSPFKSGKHAEVCQENIKMIFQ